MTAVSSIITRAYRRSNTIAIGSTPTSNEQSEGLDLLNAIIQGAVGFEVGQDLSDLNVGGPCDQSAQLSYCVPENARLLCNLTAAKTVKLNPHPYEGERFSVVDVPGNFATYPFTIDGNGRTVELDPIEILSTNGFYGQWMYRGDTGDWTRITDLLTTDDLPFPTEFEPYFVDELAFLINPSHGVVTSPDAQAARLAIKGKIRARYRKPRRPNEPVYGLLHQRRYYGGSKAAFDAGIA